jgi:hypothetical protein
VEPGRLKEVGKCKCEKLKEVDKGQVEWSSTKGSG